MTPSGRAYLNLIRIPNVTSALADPIAGFLCAGGAWARWCPMTVAAIAGALLYAGGVVLNDCCDIEKDAAERASRPIPSGVISRRAAFRLALAFLGTGLVACCSLSIRSSIIGAVLLVCIVLYDAVLKSTWIAPGLMGMCRMLNLLLGASVTTAPLQLEIVAPAGLIWLYVTAVTCVARTEATASSRTRVGFGLAGILVAVAGLTVLPILAVEFRLDHLVGVALLAAAILPCSVRAVTAPSPARVQRAVRRYVTFLVYFDSVIVWAIRGWAPAIAVAVLYVPIVILARRYRVT